MEIVLLVAGIVTASFAHVGIVVGRSYEKVLCVVALMLPAVMIFNTVPQLCGQIILDPNLSWPRYMVVVCWVALLVGPQLMRPAARVAGGRWKMESRRSVRRTLRSEVRERVRFHYGDEQ